MEVLEACGAQGLRGAGVLELVLGVVALDETVLEDAVTFQRKRKQQTVKKQTVSSFPKSDLRYTSMFFC